MNSKPETCPECGALCAGEACCEAYFHQMLYWENENPENGDVHHLTVLCFHLQHPSRYSPEGLAYAIGLLVDFVARGVQPAEVRRRSRDQVRSDRRGWKVTSRPGSVAAYQHPVTWSMTAADVVEAGEPQYRQQVRAWANAILAALQGSLNLPSAL